MKKSNKILTLALSLLGVVSLTGCNSGVTTKDNIILEFKFGDNQETVTYTADDLLLNKLTSRSGTEDYYNAVYELMVRKIFDGWTQTEKDEVNSYADDEVKIKKQEAKDAASTNSSSYDTEWEAILDSSGVKDEHELWLKFQLEKIKEKLGDEYYNSYKSWVKSENPSADEQELNLVWGNEGYINTALPYHVKHILVKEITSDANDYSTAHISEDKATQLGNIIKKLALGEKFGDVAIYSDDTTNNVGGDLGIMSITEGYVPEFKLGVYTYDSIFNDTTSKNATKEEKNVFGASKENLTDLENLGVQEIPYEAVERLIDFADDTGKGVEINDGNEDYLPRNIIFNKYFNNRNLAVITPTSSSVTKESRPTKVNGGASVSDKFIEKEYYTDLTVSGNEVNNSFETGHIQNGLENETYKTMKGFQKVTINGEEKTILCDDKGNPILLVRVSNTSGNAYEGVHLIVVERSALDTSAKKVPLNEYYAPENPLSNDSVKNPNFPTDEEGNQVTTFVNSKTMKYSDYNSRVSTLKDNIKGFDKHYDMRVYKWIEKEANVTIATLKINDKEIDMKKRIDAYLESTITDDKIAKIAEQEKTWNEFIEHLEEQQNQRKRKLIPETCALNYDANSELYKEGGICYYVK